MSGFERVTPVTNHHNIPPKAFSCSVVSSCWCLCAWNAGFRPFSLSLRVYVRRQRGHAFSLDHVLVASDEARVPDAHIWTSISLETRPSQVGQYLVNIWSISAELGQIGQIDKLPTARVGVGTRPDYDASAWVVSPRLKYGQLGSTKLVGAEVIMSRPY